MIFSQNARTDTSPKNYSESTFAHIDRSARPEYGRIRAQISDWCNHVPDAERHEFVQRITSGDDLAFHSAFLELYTHQLLLATRWCFILSLLAPASDQTSWLPIPTGANS